jgi:membrane-associated protein
MLKNILNKHIYMKFFVACLFFMALGVTIHAQEVKLKIQNQYGAKIAGLKIVVAGEEKELIAEKDGTVMLSLPASDSVKFIAKDYPLTTFPVKDLTNGSILIVEKNFTWKDLINPMFYIKYGGLWLLLFIIFAETGLFAGFFLPGDSLLFVAGIYSRPLAYEFLKLIGLGNLDNQWVDLLVLIALISAAGIIGNFVGYWFGKKVGPAMFNWKDKFLFKKKYLYQAQEFYDKNGGGAIIVARFLPIIRTFAPIVAGIVQMPKAKFTFFNIVGCIAWVTSMLCIGHFLDQAFPTLKDHLELIVIGIVLITTAPVIIKLISGNKKKTDTPVSN